MGNNRSISFDSAQHLYERNNNSNPNSPGLMKGRKRFYSSDLEQGKENADPWGWFQDFESPHILNHKGFSTTNMRSNGEDDSLSGDYFPRQPIHKALSLPPPATEPPIYILESSLETQQLWYSTAGRRPRQPAKEREYFEQLWKENFEASDVNYVEPVDVVPVSSSSSSDVLHGGNHIQNTHNSNNNISINLAKKLRMKSRDTIHVSEFDGEVVFRGKAPFSHSVSKSFNDHYVSSMTIHIPYYRIFRSSANSALRAEFLVVVSMGSPSTVTFGLWRRHSDFAALAASLKEPAVAPLSSSAGGGAGTRTAGEGGSGKKENSFKNTLLSWDCVLQRKRWFKCLDKDYLSLKSFLLERFMHDLLFESTSPQVINKFLGLDKGKKH